MTSIASNRSPRILHDEELHEILVPVTSVRESERGAAIAADYGELWQVPVRLVHVRIGDEPTGHLALDAAVSAISSAHPDLPVEGIEIEADSIVSGISAAATEQSLLLLASDYSSQWRNRGSVAEAVMQAADDLVVLCGAHCERPPVGSSVVVPLDGSTRAEAALAPAIAIAEQAKSKLWILTVLPASTVATVASLRARGERVSEDGYLLTLADHLENAGLEVGWEVLHDEDPVHGVNTFVGDHAASIVVAATHGDTGIAKRLFGSVCLGLVETGTVPVVVVKSDGSDPVPLLATT